MSRAYPRARRARRTPEKQRSAGAHAEESAAPARNARMPAYAESLDASPSVPLLGPQAHGEGALAQEDEEKGEAPAAETASPEARVEEAKEALAAQDEGGQVEAGAELEAEAQEGPEAAAETQQGEPGAAVEPVEPVGDVSGVAEPEKAVAFSNLALRGRTDANFQSSFRTVGVQTSRGTGCQGCAAGECVHVTGTLESTFTVTTTVTLPSVSDFPDLTPCQRQRVSDAIANVLAPHEQQHVAAFNTYNGTTSTPFDMTLCRAQFDSSIQALHNSVEGTRRAAAQALSDALDPFVFNVDIDCQEPRPPAPRGTTAEEGAEEPSV
ncbi:MAG: hypothetical protein LC795_15305 [Acidobacteria bacterium]|nr:hypothetical protein [Acidobacteriota bacterium]MCA1620643.1 hypothetical protein [Acidobacteriota bacterium]